MKTVKIAWSIIVMLAFFGLNEVIGQWNYSDNNICNINSGNVGIGNNSPSTLLYEAKNMTEPNITVRNLGGFGGETFTMIDDASGAIWKFKATLSGGFKIRDHTNLMDVFTLEPNNAANAINIKGGGNVGIGTTNPAANLHVAESSPGFTGVFGTPVSPWNASTNVSIGDDNGLSALYIGQSASYNGYVYWNYFDPPLLAFLGIGCSNMINPVILQPFGGRVGINCYPSAALHLSVSGYGPDEGLMITNTRTGGKSLTINQGVVGILNFTEPDVIDLMTMDFNTHNVGIGTTTPDQSALLDLSTSSKGFLPPRMTTAQRDAISLPVAGLTIYSTSKNCNETYNGTSWVSNTHYIGESYGGGIVFYVYDNGQHGLIASTSDQSTVVQWYNGIHRVTGTTGDGLNAGAMNTAMIVAAQMADNQNGDFAAKKCADYSATMGGVTYGDWYLPSEYELNFLYNHKDEVGGFASSYYWSSSENSDYNARLQNFSNGYQSTSIKSGTYHVRAIRAF